MELRDIFGLTLQSPLNAERVYNSLGNGTDTYTLDFACDSIMVFIDGILQTDYTHIPGTSSVVLGFIPDVTERIVVYGLIAQT